MSIVTDETSNYEVKKRKTLIAFLLSIFTPGLGQIYNGQFKKGIIFFILIFSLPFLFGVTGIIKNCLGLISLFLIEIIIRICIIIDAIMVSKKLKSYTLKKYNTWYYHLMFAIIILTISYFLNFNFLTGIQTFKATTTSCMPTIHIGDCIVVDLKAYDNDSIEYGDLVVYKSKKDKQFYYCRVIGKPSDKIEVKDNFVKINGVSSKIEFIGEKMSDEFPFPYEEYQEILPNNHKYKIYKFKKSENYSNINDSIANIESIKVPSESYFLIGDNRDNSLDSRYIGMIKREEIIGKVLYSYWGKDRTRININFTKR